LVLFTTHYQDARLQVLTMAMLDPEDNKGTAIFKTLGTTKQCHIQEHRNLLPSQCLNQEGHSKLGM